ncbi:hypothetical protein HMPREF3156_00943 [Neisseria sp. HMSC06F02]|nr:hypothetical protein HMPREF3156_00943 [Neisseria sp. HMSC06F02]
MCSLISISGFIYIENKMLWYNIMKIILIDLRFIGVYNSYRDTLLQY